MFRRNHETDLYPEIGGCHCLGDGPTDRSRPRFKRTRPVGYERFAWLTRNGSDAVCL